MATTRVDVIRGTGTSPLGDETDDAIDGAERPYTDIPAAITQRSTRVQDPETGTWRTVRYYAGRIPASVKLEDGDRLLDRRQGPHGPTADPNFLDGYVYIIDEETSTARSIAGRSTLTMNLRRLNG